MVEPTDKDKPEVNLESKHSKGGSSCFSSMNDTSHDEGHRIVYRPSTFKNSNSNAFTN